MHVSRLSRLHKIRAMQEDVEENALRRLHGEADALRERARRLRDAASAVPVVRKGAHARLDWHLAAAERQLACHHLAQVMLSAEQMESSLMAQRSRLTAAARDSRQMERLLTTAQASEQQAQGRGEQRMLDDLFSGSRSLLEKRKASVL